MKIPLISICIVTWNSETYLPSCLESLTGQDYPKLEFIVVDNASCDSSVEIVLSRLPGVKLICNRQNQGFCGGHNQGIKASNGEFYLPLNPDVLLEPGYISAMVDVIQKNESYGMAAARLYQKSAHDSTLRFDSTGLFLDRKRRQYLRGFEEEDQGQYDQVEEVFGVDGAAPLYRRSMLEDIKINDQYFDESFHSHKEDVDLAWRAKILGWRCIYTPDAIGYHKRTFKPGKRQKMVGEVKLHAVKNRYLMLIKNESKTGWKRDWMNILFYDLKIIIYLLLFERSSLKAIPMTKNLRKNALEWRCIIQQKSAVNEEEQITWFHK